MIIVPDCLKCGKPMKTMNIINNDTVLTIWVCRRKSHPFLVTNLDWRLLKASEEHYEWAKEKGIINGTR